MGSVLLDLRRWRAWQGLNVEPRRGVQVLEGVLMHCDRAAQGVALSRSHVAEVTKVSRSGGDQMRRQKSHVAEAITSPTYEELVERHSRNRESAG